MICHITQMVFTQSNLFRYSTCAFLKFLLYSFLKMFGCPDNLSSIFFICYINFRICTIWNNETVAEKEKEGRLFLNCCCYHSCCSRLIRLYSSYIHFDIFQPSDFLLESRQIFFNFGNKFLSYRNDIFFFLYSILYSILY